MQIANCIAIQLCAKPPALVWGLGRTLLQINQKDRVYEGRTPSMTKNI